MEALVILVVAASLSAGVVWWGMSPPGGRASAKVKRPRRRGPPRPTFQTTGPDPVEEPPGDGFVLLPGGSAVVHDDRPPATLSLVRLLLTITIVAAIAVATLALLGFVLKLQLDRYFTGVS